VAAGPAHATVFRFPESTLKHWLNVDDVEINVIPQYYWQNQVIPLKGVHEVMQRLHDGGGIHLGFVGGENVVRGNLIHGVRGTGSGWGLNTDAETNRERIEGNVVWDCSAPKID
jgi:hypothetical protein